MNDLLFEECMSTLEKNSWIGFKSVPEGFLGNKKDPDYKELVSSILREFQKLGSNMSVKVHFLYSHLEYFAEGSSTEIATIK